MPSLRVLCRNRVIHVHRDHLSIHGGVLQEFLAAADARLLDWPPQVPDMNSIGSMCSRVKKLCRRIAFPLSERW